MTGMTLTQSILIIAQWLLNALHASKSFIQCCICEPDEFTQLTVKEYLALSKQLDKQEVIESWDAADMKVNLEGILNKWNRYKLKSTSQYSSHIFQSASFKLC